MSHLASLALGLTGGKRGHISHQDGMKIMLTIGTDHLELLKRTFEPSELFLKVEMGQPPVNHRFPPLCDPHVSASLKTARTCFPFLLVRMHLLEFIGNFCPPHTFVKQSGGHAN